MPKITELANGKEFHFHSFHAKVLSTPLLFFFSPSAWDTFWHLLGSKPWSGKGKSKRQQSKALHASKICPIAISTEGDPLGISRLRMTVSGGAWGPLSLAPRPPPRWRAASSQRGPSRHPAGPEILTEPRAPGGAARDWPLGSRGRARGRPGGRRQ